MDMENEMQRRYKAPYTAHRPIPTIHQYEKEKQDRKVNSNQYASPQDASSQQEDDDAANQYLWNEEHNQKTSSDEGSGPGPRPDHGREAQSNQKTKGTEDEKQITEDTSEALAGAGLNAKQRRKRIGKRKGERAEREVTDPVTHLPIRIHDLQSGDLKKVPENIAPPGFEAKTATGLAGKNKCDDDLKSDAAESQKYHRELENLFPPPEYDAVKKQLIGVYSKGVTAGLTMMALVGYMFFAMERAFGGEGGLLPYLTGTGATFAGIAAVVLVILGVRKWMDNKISTIWEEELWHAERHNTGDKSHTHEDEESVKESTHWLNNVLSSIWPLVNPDLFVSLADTLEVSFSFPCHILRPLNTPVHLG